MAKYTEKVSKKQLEILKKAHAHLQTILKHNLKLEKISKNLLEELHSQCT